MMRVKVTGKTHQLVAADIAGLPVPRRTLLGRYDYGDLDEVTVDVLLDRMLELADTSWAICNDWMILDFNRHKIAKHER
jgi:hypothetical protein